MHCKGVNISGQKAGEKKRESMRAQIYDETTVTSAHEEMHTVKFQAGKTRTHAHTHMYAHTHTWVHAHTRTYTHKHACMLTRMHACTHARTHTHTLYVHSNLCSRLYRYVAEFAVRMSFVKHSKLVAMSSIYHEENLHRTRHFN